MNQTALNEEFVKKYLLGDVEEAERQRLEERLLTDEEFFQDFAVLEDRLEDVLIDEYVGGEMSDSASAGFEKVFLAAPHRVEKLRLIRALQDYVNDPAPAAVETHVEVGHPSEGGVPPSWWRSLPGFLGRSSSYVTPALALALLCAVIGAAVFYSKSRRLEEELRALQQQRPPEQGVSDELARLRARNDELAADLRRIEAERRADAEPTPTPRPTHEEEQAGARKPESRRVLTPALSLLRSRAGDGQSMPELKLPAGASAVRLLLLLGTVDPADYRRFSAAVSRRDGTSIKSSTAPKPGGRGGEAHVTVTLPAGQLTSGDYIVRLSGRQAAGTDSLVGVYDFRLVRQ